MSETVALGEVAEFVNGAAFKQTDWSDDGRKIIRIQNLTDPSKPFNRTTRDVKDAIRVRQGDLLVSWSATLGVFEWTEAEDAVLNQHIFRVIPDLSRIDKAYLRYGLEESILTMQRHVHGAIMKHINRREFLETPIVLPPLDEQRRIAAILDAANALRAKRRQAIGKLDTLTEAVFKDMFGDLRNSRWPVASFESTILKPLRNGISPSKAGHVTAEVLTLSAVTRTSFDPGALKESTFVAAIPTDRSVCVDDFLICRGNGNLSLVGRGKFPTVSLPSVAFPDTMIAASCDSALIDRAFLSHVWNHPMIRRQIEATARTTNGTHKINQAMIASIQVPLPPIELQVQFGIAQRQIVEQRHHLERGSTDLDALFGALQQRAFRSEL